MSKKEIRDTRNNRFIIILAMIALTMISLAGCSVENSGETMNPVLSSSQEVSSVLPSSQEASSQDTSSALEAAANLWAVGDVYGDGMEEMCVLGSFDEPYGTAATLWVDGEKVMNLQGQGELSENTCRLIVVDMDEDEADELLVLISGPARRPDASFRYIDWKDGVWQEQEALWPELEMSLYNGWQCTLTDGTEEWTVEVTNPTLRTNWFDATGTPVAGPMEVGAFTDCAVHTVENGQIRFYACVTVRDLSENGQGRPADVWDETTVSVSVEDGQLVTDDALCRALLECLTDTGM